MSNIQTTDMNRHDDSHDELFMQQALKVAQDALAVGEVPVGCVIVLPPNVTDDHPEAVIVSHGANQVNATRDATRHAEIVAIDRALTGGISSDQLRLPPEIMAQSARTAKVPEDSPLLQSKDNLTIFFKDKWTNVPDNPNHWKNTFGWQSGRLLDQETLSKCHLYVTCEPCIMCAAALAQIGFAKVIFGCRNDRFGGCGSILHLHDLKMEYHTPYLLLFWECWNKKLLP
jgi:tRNA-specific adenosine deaminase 2